ncbi:MAG: DUF952 domain-containing protein [Balneolaceae bacterium]|nr:DUF952 domain-containing protein [Balneolaceae bacterium]
MERQDIIFHLVSEKEWKERQERGTYRPPSLQEAGFVHCSAGRQLEEVANRLYPGERKMLLLVIDVASLEPEVRYEEGEEGGDELFPHVYGPLNTGAVIDKIKLRPEDDGTFKIAFDTKD